jgi:hypothetical protein
LACKELSFGKLVAATDNTGQIPNISDLPNYTLQPTATATRTPTPVSIGNFVWNDLDQDGIQDTGEPGYAGVLMQLWNSSRTLMLDQVTTGPSGLYQLTALGPGDYRIRAVLPSVNDSFSPKDQGSDDTKDSDIHPSGTYFGFTDVVTISSNVISTTLIDVGLIPYMVPTPTRTQTPINLGISSGTTLTKMGYKTLVSPVSLAFLFNFGMRRKHI